MSNSNGVYYKKYLFSIILPIHNEGENLRITLAGFFQQEYNDFEIILVDDGSTDCSACICDEYAQMYDYVKVIHKANGGCVDARRSGIQVAEGRYTVFADGDDKVEQNYMSDLHAAVRNSADYYILNNKVQLLGLGTTRTQKDFLTEGHISAETASEWVLSGMAGAVWDKIFITKILQHNLEDFSQNITYGEDVYINMQYLRHVHTVYTQNTDSYIHIFDSPTSVCSKGVAFSRLKEIDLLYKEGVRFIHDMKFPDVIMENFVMVEAANMVKTIGGLVKKGEQIKEIKMRLNNCQIVEDCARFRGRGIKEKVYISLLKFKLIRLSNFVCNLREHFIKE